MTLERVESQQREGQQPQTFSAAELFMSPEARANTNSLKGQSEASGSLDFSDPFAGAAKASGWNQADATIGKAASFQSAHLDFSDPFSASEQKGANGDKASAPGSAHGFSPAQIAEEAASGVDQYKIGDCVFESTVAALAGTKYGQEKISQMIAGNADGSYTVTFPGDKEHPVTVNASDLADPRIKDSAQWARILEAAVVKGYPHFADGANVPDGAPGGSSKPRSFWGEIIGLDPETEKPTGAQYAMYLLTGETATKTNAGTDDKVAEKIEEALQSDRPVTAFCKDRDNGAFVDGHMWTVTDYNPQTQEITVRNPWGNFQGREGDGIKDLGDGLVRMPLATFKKDFEEVAFLS